MLPVNGRGRIITIGGSAGAIEATKVITQCLPAALDAAVFVIIHISARSPGVLPSILNRDGMIPAHQAIEGEVILPGRVYLPPPDRHLLVAEGHIHLTRGPKEGLHRPSINMTFRSAAANYGERVIGVLLSGMLDDGASGLWEIAKNGGTTIVQDPEDAKFPSMPRSALIDVPVDYQLPAAEIGFLLRRLVSGAEMLPKRPNLNWRAEPERFSGFTCPECRGPLWEKKSGGPVEFQCRVGHLFSLQALLDEHTTTQERKLYEALVCLEEGAALAELMLTRVEEPQQEALKKEAQQLRQQAATLRKMLEEREVSSV